MYTILVKDDNSLLATVKERIMQRSKLVDTLQFLCPQTYNGLDLSNYTCLLEYVLPNSRKYVSEVLELSEDLYEDEYLQYLVPFDTKLTSENGDVELQLSFLDNEMDSSGEVTSYVRKTSTTTITIVPISAWSDLVTDDALNSIDQKLLDLDAKIEELNDLAETIGNSTPDDLTLTDDLVQLSVNGTTIGDGVQILVPVDDPDETDDGMIDLDDEEEAEEGS